MDFYVNGYIDVKDSESEKETKEKFFSALESIGATYWPNEDDI